MVKHLTIIHWWPQWQWQCQVFDKHLSMKNWGPGQNVIVLGPVLEKLDPSRALCLQLSCIAMEIAAFVERGENDTSYHFKINFTALFRFCTKSTKNNRWTETWWKDPEKDLDEFYFVTNLIIWHLVGPPPLPAPLGTANHLEWNWPKFANGPTGATDRVSQPQLKLLVEPHLRNLYQKGSISGKYIYSIANHLKQQLTLWFCNVCFWTGTGLDLQQHQPEDKWRTSQRMPSKSKCLQYVVGLILQHFTPQTPLNNCKSPKGSERHIFFQIIGWKTCLAFWISRPPFGIWCVKSFLEISGPKTVQAWNLTMLLLCYFTASWPFLNGTPS